MTTAERPPQQISIAGVPWPAYKVVALVIGLVTLVGVGAATASGAAAVLSAAAVCTAVWLILGPLLPSRR